MGERFIQYERSRFSTRLPTNRRYVPSHFWLAEDQANTWRVGFTKFATRILGEPVEYDFETPHDATVTEGDVVGWIEGFKAVTDLFAPMAGRFVGPNPALVDNIEWIRSDPYGRGWLYSLEGTLTDTCLDAAGYVAWLDTTIDKMTGKTA